MIKTGNISLIIVDDQEIVREGLKLTLQCEPGFNIIGEAANGNELIKLLENVCPDVILLDDRMPNENGIDICKRLMRRYPDIRIIILTAYAEQEDSIVRAVMAGAKGFLIKNVRIAELKRSIKAVVRGETILDSQVAKHLIEKVKEVPRKDSSTPQLTEQQLNIARLVAKGLTNKEIAANLFLSENTIKFHIQNIMRKMNVHNRVALATQLLSDTED
ncbi:response regulator [Candidatus Contubernalis alkaliaceticus]|uniref:response regulator n=1 Tax=Candidatus Contubernalis alkaliaceticus TaxID=338645 RepID=UPI001F4BE2AF|nr:response regulator transcription factor [Candidatus Contubernalis alkalaceticus]UNC93403.1 response regulator transcription factor [Candidatus Contubernalis alkalaceticus]